MEKISVIIADSLTRDFMSPKEKFLQQKVNIGMREISRLFGHDEEFGSGPLPTFLNDAFKAKQEGKRVYTILLRDIHDPNDPMQQHELLRFGNHNIIGSEGVKFVSSISGIVPHAEVIDTETLSMPVKRFHEVMYTITGKDVLELTYDEREAVSFLLVGAYTNIRVLSTASKLRNDYQFPNVFVCPRLVGCDNYEVHLSTLQIDFPNVLVQVIPGLKNFYLLAGIDQAGISFKPYECCTIRPAEINENINKFQKKIIEHLYLSHSSLNLRPLSGGYSGSLLFLAEGKKAESKTESEILKIDQNIQMQAELQGYSLVKDLLGKNVPTFSLPVSSGSYTGIKMELASMQGVPNTLQAIYEKWDGTNTESNFMPTFESTLDILISKLYNNTKKQKKYYPYKELGLHAEQQAIWLGENIKHILPDADIRNSHIQLSEGISIQNPLARFTLLTRNVDRLLGDVCIAHGDLNFANIVSDQMRNVWIIDWTHTGEKSVELDFAKMESDIKFVMDKSFREDDLSKLRQFETFILSSISLPEVSALPESLSFLKYDLRFLKIYSAVGLIRKKYLSVRNHNLDILYKTNLLKYAVHTLSFDARRKRGECKLPQLKYALLSVALLITQIASDDLHKKIGKDKPDPYPNRYPVLRGLVNWDSDYSGYKPDYYVHPAVLRNDKSINSEGWADPEDITKVGNINQRKGYSGDIRMDLKGRPLNPKGRVGIQGRGMLGKWGPNYAADPVVTRCNPVTNDLEVVLIKREDTQEWGLPGAIIVGDETYVDTANRALKQKTHMDLDFRRADVLSQMYIEDFRNTDNAWMESTALHLHLTPQQLKHVRIEEGFRVKDAAWVILTTEVINHLFANHSDILKKALNNLVKRAELSLDKKEIEKILLEI